ncbi:hypothetical protein KO525_05275 [Psychrosphaera sp. B3R10]|uniref:hypothetical protein n=1 Tax=unclassified Psychrosphaera TaxID=2641570 RepID=UPI001C09F20F|nr:MULTISPECIES: hypothetical protein [unclassified Psychrosphaera]MBU2881993.1 hypothetical protein [Psychrosphaera sp. I2R16]MBU2988785.1 hypothetical protein [Psychrosphaera sp. B3R10]MDO6721610.1 hypothetical protein [Psychrosphaera sp. 1_MG-2023]
MMKNLLFVISILPSILFAEGTTVLSPTEAKEFGIIFKPWTFFKEYEIEEHKEFSDCTYFEIRFPQTKPNGSKPKYIKVGVDVLFNKRTIALLELPMLTDVENSDIQYAYGCLPLKDEFDVSLTFIYGTGGLCFPSYSVPSVKKYLKELNMLKEL